MPNEGPQAVPAIWLRSQTEGAMSTSKLGGLPGLPEDVEWPRQRQTGTPLHFLAQIDLLALPETPLKDGQEVLPPSGFLFFFADLSEEMLWENDGGPLATTRVIFTDRMGPERSAPAAIPEIFHAARKMAGGYETGITVYPQAGLEAYVIETFTGIHPWDNSDDYSAAALAAMVRSMEKAIGPIPVATPPFDRQVYAGRAYIVARHKRDGGVSHELIFPRHQMLGVGKNVQGTADKQRAKGNILLLQLDSDTAVHEHYMFCDMGVAQFWITPEDLAARRFDQAWGTTEGG